MPQTEKTSFVTTTLAQIMTACTLLRKALEESDLPNIAPDLLTIYVAVDELLELAVPTPSEGEIHGLPKMATTTHFSRLTFKHADNPDWDYQPWFAGKIVATKDHIRRAIEVWREFQEGPDQKLREELLRHVTNCQTYADLVYQEVINDRLEITELSAE